MFDEFKLHFKIFCIDQSNTRHTNLACKLCNIKILYFFNNNIVKVYFMDILVNLFLICQNPAVYLTEGNNYNEGALFCNVYLIWLRYFCNFKVTL